MLISITQGLKFLKCRNPSQLWLHWTGQVRKNGCYVLWMMKSSQPFHQHPIVWFLANPSPLGFSYLLGPCSTFSELENYSRESSTKLLTLPSLWESSIHSLDFPYYSHLISPKAVSNPDYTLPVSQMPQALHLQSQTHHLTLQTYFSSSRVPLFHERHPNPPSDSNQKPASFSLPLHSQTISKALIHCYCHCPSSGLIIF